MDHGPHRALNFHWLDRRFYEALQKSWGPDTCWNGCRADYPEDGSNPSFGNCLVSVLAAWGDRFFREKRKDRIVPCLFRTPDMDSDGWHFQLETDLGTVDPTFQQFPPDVEVTQLTPEHPSYGRVVHGSFFDPAERASLRQRLDLLLARMKDNGYDTHMVADAVLYMVDREFSHIFRPRRIEVPRPGGP